MPEEAEDFVSDAEIAKRWRVSTTTARIAIRAFERNPRFPKRDPVMGNKRFWPAVRAFMRWRYGMESPPQVADGEDHFERGPGRKR